MKIVPKWPAGRSPARSRPTPGRTGRPRAGPSRMSRMSVAQRSRAVDPPDEVAPVAGQVEERRVGVDVALQEPDDLAPDRVLGADLALVEPGLVELRQEPRHRRPASSSARIQGTTSSSIASRRGRGLEAQDVARLADVGHAQLDVVLERRVGDVAERLAVAADLAPDRLGQLEHRRRRRRRQVEVVVDRVLRLHGEPDPVGQVAAVGVVADLVALAQDVQRVLALEDLERPGPGRRARGPA